MKIERAKNMGKAWQCLRCYYKEQTQMVDRKMQGRRAHNAGSLGARGDPVLL